MDDRKSTRREAENRRRAQKGLPPVGQWGGRRNGSGRRSPASQPHPETDDGAGAAPFGLSRAQFARAMQEMVDRLAPAAAANPIRPALTIARHPPAAMPPAGMEMAADSALTGNFDWAATEWVNSLGGGLTVDSVSFPGFATLAEYAQRPEFRVISETIAGDMTRKWIDFNVTGDETERQDAKRRAELDPVGEAERAADLDARRKRIAGAGKLDRVKVIKDEMDRLGVRDHFYALARDDGFFGRSHLFLDFGYGMDSDELAVPIGNGRDAFSRSKVAKNSLRGLRTIEAVWVYPQAFNAVNPFDVSWYNPQSWYVQGRHVSGSRLLTFVGRAVPDFIKPAYSFGGLSLSQLVKPYVDNWLKTRTAVASIIHSFSVMVLMTDLQSILADSGSALMGRVALFNMLRDNQGCFVVNKNSEDFKNVSAPLSGLHELQAQAQEHLSSVSRIPLVKLTGIQPAGLNACLPGDTLIFTDRGHIPIRDVTLSDRVMTRRGFSPLVFSGITKFATEMIEIRTADKALRCTANHPIWLSSTNEFVPAENVRAGDCLLLIGERSVTPSMPSAESADVISVRRVQASEPVYDLSVAPGHLPEFFANSILTHNSSEGEIKVYDDSIADYQNRFFRPNLTRVIDFIQLSLFGDIDPEITFDFEPLRELTEKERAEKDKADAERHEKYVNMGAIDAGEVRQVIIEDPTLPYTALDPDDISEPPSEGEGDLFGPDDDDGGGSGPAGEGFNKDKGKQVPVQTGDMALDAIGLDDATWRESDHQRDKGGKFTTTGGGGAGGGGEPQKKTETKPQKTEAKPDTAPEPKKAALPSGEMPDIPDFLRRGPKAEPAPSGAGKEGGGEKRGTGGAASKLYRPTTESADSVVAKVPGAREAIADVMARMSEGVPTDSLPSEGGFKNEDGSYTPEREAIHREILSRIFTPEALARAKPAEGEKPTLTILGGRGGSGKSWITQENGPVDATKSILLDSDWIKSQLPEYQGWNANLVHEESSNIVLEADRIARAAGVNVIHDATLRSEGSVAKRVAQFEAAGYELEGYYMHCPPEIAAQRALSRFKTRKGDFSGRFVPPEVILGNVSNEANFDKLSTGMKRWAIYDNSTAEGPQLVSKSWKD